MLVRSPLLFVNYLFVGCIEFIVCDVAFAQLLSFPTEARFQFGDRAEWASEQFDDSDWPSVRIPEAWTSGLDPWISQPAGWYRIRFQLPPADDPTYDELAICCGVIGDACELYLNGERIGSYGILYPNFDALPKAPLVFELPPRLLHRTTPNTLAIRIHRYVSGGGIIRGPILLGKSAAVRDAVIPVIQRNWFCEGFLLAILAVPTLFSLALLLSGNREREIALLSLGSCILILGCLLDSRIFLETFGFHPLRLLASSCCVVLLPVIAHLLVAKILSFPMGRVTLAVLMVVSCVLVGCIIRIEYYFVAGWIWLITQWCFQLCWVIWLLLAIRDKQEDAMLVGLGLLAIIVSTNVETLGLWELDSLGGQPFSLVGIGGFYACGLWVTSRRFERIRARMAAASIAVLSAHEEERKRISRELHDGVCQTLAAVHLSLQVANEKLSQSESLLEPLIELVRQGADDIRAVSQGLRPEYLEKMTFSEAVHAFTGSLSDQATFHFQNRLPNDRPLTPTLSDVLYRIVQEACSNAVKHADATLVEIQLSEARGNLQLSIVDDGSGIDATASSGDLGLGTTTIVERARLLGGNARIYPRKPTGTCVDVSVPFDIHSKLRKK